jgi:hypothetical protein
MLTRLKMHIWLAGSFGSLLVVLDICHSMFLSLGRGKGKRGLLVARVTGGQIIFSIYSTFFWTGSVWFGLTGFCLTKPKPNWTEIFLKYYNRFFSVRFLRLIFFWFSRFNRFIGFFITPCLDVRGTRVMVLPSFTMVYLF